MKFSDEAISRVLSEHSVKGLQRKGVQHWSCNDKCCLIQAAMGKEDIPLTKNYLWNLAGDFDDSYDPAWSADEFVAWMTKQGVL